MFICTVTENDCNALEHLLDQETCCKLQDAKKSINRTAVEWVSTFKFLRICFM